MDEKVIRYCKKQGFQIQILDTDWVPLGSDFNLLCHPFTDGDSWICFKTQALTLLNVNDCQLYSKKALGHIGALVGKVDVLMSQFSYANWVGNRDQKELRQEEAAAISRRLIRQIQFFQPRFTVPFASFVWFCHAENFYLNEDVNKVDTIQDMIFQKTSSTPVVLYPGDTWAVGTEVHDSAASIERYNVDYSRIGQAELFQSVLVPVELLIAQSKVFCENLRKNNSLLLTKFILKPTTIYLDDLQCSFKLDLFDGLSPAPEAFVNDISMAAGSLSYCFLFSWGGDTPQY